MNYRTDHIAIRTLNREKCVNFLEKTLGYKEEDRFPIYFNDEKTDVATCSVLVPNNRKKNNPPWIIQYPWMDTEQSYSLDYEIFVSEGTPGSIVYNWATTRGGAGLHHMALQIPDNTTIENEIKKWQTEGWADFSTSEAIVCPELKQIFTKPSIYTGFIYELIERKTEGFCRSSVKALMESTRND